MDSGLMALGAETRVDLAVRHAPMPVVLVSDADGGYVTVPNELSRQLTAKGEAPFPVSRIEEWEDLLGGLVVGDEAQLAIVVDGLEYGRRWNLDRNRTSWAVTLTRLAEHHWSVFAADMTGQYRYVDMLEDTLASRNRAFERLAAVAHELKQPITAIRGFSQLLEENASDPEVGEFLQLITSEADTMVSLIEDLLTSGLVASERLRIETEAYAVGQVAEELKRTAATFHDREIEVSVDADHGQSVYVDLRRLGQVVRGLIQNAVKYGGPKIEVRATLEGDRFTVEVRDDGSGVPPDEVGRIFEPFSPGTAGRRLGTGIGLAVARSIVADMGGLLEYRRGDPGAVFVVTLHAHGQSTRSALVDQDKEQRGLLAELTDYRRDEARMRLNQLAFRHLAVGVIEDVVCPVMYELGDQWARGEISVAQEHHASSVVLSWLIDAMARYRPWRRQTVVCVSSPGGQHEIGTACVAVALAEAGYRIIYLGRGVPVADLVETARSSGAAAVIISVTLPEQRDGAAAVMAALSDDIRGGLIVGMGGYLFAGGVGHPGGDSYLGSTARDAVEALDVLLRDKASA